MPTYEYVCSSCQNQWEEVQKISEPAIKKCPKCAKKTAKRQISGGNFILKGGGWYADLYSSPKPAKKDEAGASSDAKPKEAASTEGGKTKEAAPAAKTESTAPKTAAGSSG